MKRKGSAPKAAVDDKANHTSMHEMELGKADTLPDQSTAPGTKGEVLAFNALCIAFSGYNSTFRYVLLICVIAICIDRINMEGSQQGSQFVQVFVFTGTKTIGQRNAGTMVNCPPQPILL